MPGARTYARFSSPRASLTLSSFIASTASPVSACAGQGRAVLPKAVFCVSRVYRRGVGSRAASSAHLYVVLLQLKSPFQRLGEEAVAASRGKLASSPSLDLTHALRGAPISCNFSSRKRREG